MGQVTVWEIGTVARARSFNPRSFSVRCVVACWQQGKCSNTGDPDEIGMGNLGLLVYSARLNLKFVGIRGILFRGNFEKNFERKKIESITLVEGEKQL